MIFQLFYPNPQGRKLKNQPVEATAGLWVNKVDFSNVQSRI
jgi:hypothetical protein